MGRNTLTITLDGRTITAHREAHTTGGADPTCTIRWTGGEGTGLGFDIREFQGVYTGKVHACEYDAGDEGLVSRHASLEAAFYAMERWLSPTLDEDPMGGPEE